MNPKQLFEQLMPDRKSEEETPNPYDIHQQMYDLIDFAGKNFELVQTVCDIELRDIMEQCNDELNTVQTIMNYRLALNMGAMAMLMDNPNLALPDYHPAEVN